MADLMEYVNVLADQIGPRPVSTEEEHQASIYIAQELSDDGLDVSVDEFATPSGVRWPYVLAFAAAALGTVISGIGHLRAGHFAQHVHHRPDSRRRWLLRVFHRAQQQSRLVEDACEWCLAKRRGQVRSRERRPRFASPQEDNHRRACRHRACPARGVSQDHRACSAAVQDHLLQHDWPCRRPLRQVAAASLARGRRYGPVGHIAHRERLRARGSRLHRGESVSRPTSRAETTMRPPSPCSCPLRICWSIPRNVSVTPGTAPSGSWAVPWVTMLTRNPSTRLPPPSMTSRSRHAQR